MFYLINKESGPSSYKAIKIFANKIKEIKKIGHTGTLDPLASGILLVATNSDTKLIPYIDKGFKTYHVFLELGKTSSTFDRNGEIKKTNKPLPSKKEIKNQILTFLGKQKQLPPIFSAKKIQGKRAYQLAREGKKVALKLINIEIKKIWKIKVNIPFVSFHAEVSRGTYIRTLVSDLGKKLNCGALMSNLERTKIGPFTLKQNYKKVNVFKILQIPKITLKKEEIVVLSKGHLLAKKNPNGIFALKYGKEVLGIVESENNKIKVKKLFGQRMKKVGF